MIIELPFNFQLRVYFSKQEKREGVCSKIFDKKDEHILLWDFDNIDLFSITNSLEITQQFYNLPTIYVVRTSLNRYHAYCFTARSFRRTVHILSSVPEIDVEYLRLGIVRGYFTLRISERKNETFELAAILKSEFPDETNPLDVTTNEYWTNNRGQFNEQT